MRYTLMHANKEVCDVELTNGCTFEKVIEMYDSAHLPLQCQQPGRDTAELLGYWWVGRGIPRLRARTSMALSMCNAWTVMELQEQSQGLSLSDHYWLRHAGSTQTWENVNYFQNDWPMGLGDWLFFSDRYAKELNNPIGAGPDAATNGMTRKRWVIAEDGTRWLKKSGEFDSCSEAIREYAFSAVAKLLGIDCAIYKMEYESPEHSCEHKREPCCLSKCFTTDKIELVTANAIKFGLPPHETLTLYEQKVSHFNELCQHDVRDKINQMILIDYLLCNADRHFSSFGLLRNSETMEYIGVAPLFDNGSILWGSTTFIDEVGVSDTSITFEETHHRQMRLISNLDWLDFDKLQEVPELIATILVNGYNNLHQQPGGIVPYDYAKRVDVTRRQVELRVAFIRSKFM